MIRLPKWPGGLRKDNRMMREQDMEEEFRFHLEMEIAQNLKSGMSPIEARRQAHIAFGGMDIAKEAVRDKWNRKPGWIRSLFGVFR